jgi:predicted RNA-binding protein with RPS1 domain
MGGGDGAKERRRLKRLQNESGEGDQDRRSPKNKTTFPPNKKPRPFDGKRKETVKKPTPIISKKKSKKPKHLKRKLEQADDADADTRKVVLSEMANWERKKSLFLGIPIKKQKVETPSTKPVVSEPESPFVAQPEVDFPREPVAPKPKTNKSSESKTLPSSPTKRKSVTEKKLAKITIPDSDEPSLTKGDKKRKSVTEKKLAKTTIPNSDEKFLTKGDKKGKSVTEKSLAKTTIPDSDEPSLTKGDTKEKSVTEKKLAKTTIADSDEPTISKGDKKRKPVTEKSLAEAKTIIPDSDKPSKNSQVEIDDRNPDSNEVPAKSDDHKPKKEDDVDAGELSDDGSAGSEDIETEQRRQRGRRRRGRKDTAKQIEESKELNESDTEEKTAENGEENKETKSLDVDASEATDTSDKVRYCVGRKPVTDFVIGQKYSARVVYVKTFGVFFDIGCHSDGFCHVSRLADDFVEKPEEIFKEGDQTEVRVVEINRREKKITVSLQSETRLEDEIASIDARKKRMNIRKAKYNNKRPKIESSEEKPAPADDPNRSSQSSEAPKEEKARAPEPAQQSKSQFVPNSSGQSAETRSIPKHESEMTPAELKRARKIARRASRRAQSDAP